MAAPHACVREAKLNVFPGGHDRGPYAGVGQGSFAEDAVAATFLGPPCSVVQMAGPSQAAFATAIAAGGDVAASTNGRAEAPVGPQPDLPAFMKSDDELLRLATTRAIERIEDLEGKTASAGGAPAGCRAFALCELLRRSGSESDAYRIRRVGGMARRLRSLAQSDEDGTLLPAPYDPTTQSEGPRRTAEATAAPGGYHGGE